MSLKVKKVKHFYKLEKECAYCKKVLPIWCFNKNEGRLRSRCKYCDKNARYKHLYGISFDEFKIILKKQGNKCVLCGEPLDEFSRATHIDHDHIHGNIRGILCRQCNTALGKLGDTPKALERVIVYLTEGYEALV